LSLHALFASGRALRLMGKLAQVDAMLLVACEIEAELSLRGVPVAAGAAAAGLLGRSA